MSVPEHTITIDRSDTRPVMFTFKTETVNGTEPISLLGSTFELVLVGQLGAQHRVDGTVYAGTVSFDLTPELRTSLPRGRSGRFELLRTINGQAEVWARGDTIITGGV